MDASKLRIADTGAIHIKDAAGQPLFEGEKPVRIIVHSPGTLAYSAIETRQTERILTRMEKGDGQAAKTSAAEAHADQADDLADLTVAFENLTYGDKKGRDLFHAVYSDPALGFITKQVVKFLGSWGNFKPASATS